MAIVMGLCPSPLKIWGYSPLFQHAATVDYYSAMYYCDWIWKNLASTHKIKLAILPELDCWLNTLSHSTVCLALKSRVWFLWQHLPPCVSTIGYPLQWCQRDRYATKGCSMSFSFSLCIMLWAQGGSNKASNGTSGFQSSSYSILHSYIKPTSHPTLLQWYHVQYRYPDKKAALNSLNFGCLKVIHPHNYS